MCSFGLFCISLVGWIETLGELSQIVRAQILVCDRFQKSSFEIDKIYFFCILSFCDEI